MSHILTDLVCKTCGISAPNNNETSFCPECGTEDPWKDMPRHTFNTEDLPITFSISHGGHKWELWESFCEEYFGNYELNGSEISGLPEDFPPLKYAHIEAHYVITEDLELHGPFLDKTKTHEFTT